MKNNQVLAILNSKIKSCGSSGGEPVDAYTKTETDNLLLNKVDKEEGKSLFSGKYNDLTDKPSIPSKITDLTDYSDFATNESVETQLEQKADKASVTEINSNLCELSNNNSTSNLCGTKAYTEKLYYAPLNVGDKFTISKKDTSLSIGGTTQEIIQFDENGNKLDYWSLYDNNLPRTITCEKDSVYLGFKEDASNCPFMVNYGEVKPYQEYNGCSNLGLTYRVDKQNESLDNQGLLNKVTEMQQGRWNISSGVFEDGEYYVSSKESISCNGNSNIKLKCDNAEVFDIVFFNGSSFISGESKNGSELLFTAPSSATSFKFNIYNGNQLTSQNIGKIEVYVDSQIEQLKNDLDTLEADNVFSGNILNGKSMDYLNNSPSITPGDYVVFIRHYDNGHLPSIGFIRLDNSGNFLNYCYYLGTTKKVPLTCTNGVIDIENRDPYDYICILRKFRL